MWFLYTLSVVSIFLDFLLIAMTVIVNYIGIGTILHRKLVKGFMYVKACLARKS